LLIFSPPSTTGARASVLRRQPVQTQPRTEAPRRCSAQAHQFKFLGLHVVEDFGEHADLESSMHSTALASDGHFFHGFPPCFSCVGLMNSLIGARSSVKYASVDAELKTFRFSQSHEEGPGECPKPVFDGLSDVHFWSEADIP